MVCMSTAKTQNKEKSVHDMCIVMCVSDILTHVLVICYILFGNDIKIQEPSIQNLNKNKTLSTAEPKNSILKKNQLQALWIHMLRKAYVSIKLMGDYTNRICPASIICLTVSAKCLSSFPKRLPNRNHMKPPVQREKAMEGPLLLRKKCLSTKSSFNHHFAGSIMEDRVVIINKISQKWISSYPCPGYQDTFYSLWYWYSIV